MGKISDLIKILKGEGDLVGARRAERVGDEAPYAAERISADTLRQALSGRGDNADTVALIRPYDFKWLAETLPTGYLDEPRTPKLEAPPNTSPREYIRGLQTIAREQGFRDIPFLTYGEHEGTTRLGVTGHEGRHRMRALENLGDEKALVRLLPRASVREPLPRRSRSEFLEALAAKYGDPMYLDPEGVESSAAVDLTKPVQPFGKGSLVKPKKFTKKDLSAMGAELETSTGSLVELARKYPQIKDRSIADIGTMSDEDVIDAYRALVLRKGAPLRKEKTPSTTLEPGVALGILQNAPVIIRGNEFIEPEGVLRTYRNIPVSKTEVYVPSFIDEVMEQNIDPSEINVKTKRAGKMKLADIFKHVRKERELLADVSELTPEDFVFTVEKGFSPTTLMRVAEDVARGEWKGAEDYLKYQFFTDREKAIADLDEFAADFRKRVQPFQAGGLAKFFSAVDEAVANLRQKKGTGEQMLKQIQQSPGVKKEEIELRRLPEKLAGQQKVTQEDIQAMLKAVPAPKLKMTVRSDKPQKLMQPEIETWIDQSESRRKFVSNLLRHGYAPIQNPEDPGMIGFLSPDGDITDVDELKDLFATELEYAAEAMRDARNAYYGMFANNRGTGAYKEGVSRENVDAAQIEYADAKAQHSDIQGQYAALIEFNNDWNVATKFGSPPKFEHFTSKGPKQNYRELEIQLSPEERKVIERPPFEYGRQGLGGDPEILTPEEGMQRLGFTDVDDLGGNDVESVLYYPTGMYIVKAGDGKYVTIAPRGDFTSPDLAQAEEWLSREMEPELRAPMYEPGSSARPFVQPTHFPEPDIVVHTRVSDRVGPNGEKILYVEEIQSDWHQKARKLKMEAAESIADSEIVGNEIADEARRQVKIELGLDPDAELPLFLPESTVNVERRFKEKRAELKKQRIAEEMKKLPKDYGYQIMGTRTPPWQQTSHELAVKQLLDTAANEGYDKVVFSPGSEHVERYNLGNYLERLKVTDTGDAYIIDAVTKDGQPITKGVQTRQELADNIGDDKVALIFEQFAQSEAPGGKKQAVLKGDDLVLGDTKAQGKLKIYDEIIPQYLGKYAGKEFNVQPGRTPIPTEDVEEMRVNWERAKTGELTNNLVRSFSEGSLDETTDFELRNILEEYKLKQIKREILSPSYRSPSGSSPYIRFMDKFAKSPEIVGDDIEFLVESLDPSSFGRGTGLVANIDPEKIRFKDPARQAEYEQFLEDEWLNYDMDEQTRKYVLYPRVRAIAEEKILNMSPEELFKDAPLPKTITGASIDITPEMREKIRTKGQPLFAVPPAAAGAALLQEEEPVQEYKEAGRVEKKKGMQQEQFDPPFDESRRMGPKVGVSSGPAKIRDLAKILRGENSEQQNLSRQRIAGNVEAGKGLGEYLYDMMVPQTGWEWAAEAALFPVPRPVRKGLLAAAGAMYDPEAEAGKLTLLHGSPSKIKSLQEGKDLWATTDPEYALKRAMDKMRIAEGARGPGYLNQFQIEDTDLMRLADKYSPEDIAIARRAFSKLPEGREMTGEEIYEVASTNTGGAKTAALEGVTRALGKKGYQVPPGAADKGDWYRVLNQTDLERFGKGGKVIDALKGALKMTDEAPDPSRRKAIGLREQITQPGAMTTVETEVSASELDTLQKAMGNVGQAILNEPVSRREVLKRGALSTASNLIPGGGVLQQVAKEVAPAAVKANLPQIGDEEALARIAKYALGTFDDYGLAENVYGKLTGKSAKQSFNLETEDAGPDAWELWDRVSFEKDYDDVAKMAGLDIATIAQKTNLSPETVHKLVGNDADAIASLINSSGAYRGLQDVLENVPGYEVREITQYDELWSDEEQVNDAVRKAIKIGKNQEDIIGLAFDEMRSKFFEMQRGKSKSAFDEKITQTLIDDGLLDALWTEALEDDNMGAAAYDIILKRMNELK